MLFSLIHLLTFSIGDADFRNPFSVILVLIIVFAGFAGLITLLIAEIVSGAEYLAKVVPHQLETLITHLEYLFVSQIIPLYNQLANLVNDLGSGGQETIINNIQNVGHYWKHNRRVYSEIF